MIEAVAQEYTANLCHMMMSTEMVPYKQALISAANDGEAIRKATEWVTSVPEVIEGDTWLVLKQGARGIYHQRLGTS
jgi:hypothetical protein